MNAGYRTHSAPVLFFAAKTVLTLLLPGLFLLYTGLFGIEFKQPNTFMLLLILLRRAISCRTFYLNAELLSSQTRDIRKLSGRD